MNKQHTPRRLLLQRIAVYSAMVLATVGLVAVLIFILLGYQFNRDDGRIEQGGLVQFESKPSGADVVIDDIRLGTRTSSKATLTSGKHTIKMERKDYRSWQKTVDVVKGSVLWLNYVRMIPNQITTSNVADLDKISSTAVSPDRKWMAIKEDPGTPTLRLADLSQEDIKLANLDLPTNSYTASASATPSTFTIEKWDPTSHMILVRHIYNGDRVEWIIVDSQNVSNTKNITKSLGVNASKVVFTRNTNTMYVLADGIVRKVDLGANTLSGPLLANIVDFSVFDNSKLVYVTGFDTVANQRTVGYWDDGNGKGHTLRAYHDDGTLPLKVQISSFFNETYVAIAYNEDLDVLAGDLPHEGKDDVAAVMQAIGNTKLAGGVQFLSIKNNGRFVVAQSGATYTVFDNELQKTTTTTLKDAVKINKEFEWLDDYIVYGDANGTLRLYEFDGANQQDIMPVVPGFNVTLSPNNKYIYGVVKSDNGFQLKRAKLIL